MGRLRRRPWDRVPRPDTLALRRAPEAPAAAAGLRVAGLAGSADLHKRTNHGVRPGRARFCIFGVN